MRRLAAFLTVGLCCALTLGAGTSSSPSPTEPASVVLRLVHQTMWNDPTDTTLSVTVRAVNQSSRALDDLSLFIGLSTSVGSRTEYELSLREDTGFFLLGNTTPVAGSIPAGSSRTLHLPATDLSELAARGLAIYPMKIELRSHDSPIATLRSPVVFLSKNPPDVPLDLTWTFVLASPILYEPGGSFRAPWLQRQVAHGGPLRAEAEALAKLAARPHAPSIDVAVAPQLVDQLVKMRRGYTLVEGSRTVRVPAGRGPARGADRVLQDLKTMAASRSVELSALPFSSPSIPGLIGAGLSGDLPAQLSQGRADVESALGRVPSTSVFHPPASRLDQESAFELHQNGIGVLLVDERTVGQPEEPRGYAKPAVAALSVGTSSQLDAVAPSESVQSLLSSTLPTQDPHLAVQSIVGELASIWLEQPSFPRGVALILSERTRPPGYFFAPFLRAIAAAPWLNPMKATTLVRRHPPTTPQPAAITSPAGPTFSSTYLTDLEHARESIATYRSIVTDDKTLPTQLDQLVLLAEAGQFATDEARGEEFLNQVQTTFKEHLGLVAADTTVKTRTLASRNGTIPVSILNRTGHPVRVKVELQSSHLRFQHNGAQVVRIPGDSVTLLFPVQARTTGRFPLLVAVKTPDGTTTLSTRTLVVRSTAYNRVALVITIGAALFLLALWARRFLSWTKR